MRPSQWRGWALAAAADLADKHLVVRGWLAKQRRIRLHFTPTSASWLNLVEVFF